MNKGKKKIVIKKVEVYWCGLCVVAQYQWWQLIRKIINFVNIKFHLNENVGSHCMQVELKSNSLEYGLNLNSFGLIQLKRNGMQIDILNIQNLFVTMVLIFFNLWKNIYLKWFKPTYAGRAIGDILHEKYEYNWNEILKCFRHALCKPM